MEGSLTGPLWMLTFVEGSLTGPVRVLTFVEGSLTGPLWMLTFVDLCEIERLCSHNLVLRVQFKRTGK